MIESSKTQKSYREHNGIPELDAHNKRQLTQKERLNNLNEARKQWAAAGYNLASKVERDRRYAVCKECDSFSAGRCKECGCFMKVKSLLAGMTCRLDKW